MEKEYKKRIIYQIYPASFCDSNDDGWGDINGITSKLDYLKSLGVGIIWLSPIYASPMADMGYDISDYKKINPLFGTMEDFDNMLHECSLRDIKVVMDLVMNHTSDEHYWFKNAISDSTSKYRDYYYIRKGKGKNCKKPPNNWTSIFTGPAWERIENDPEYYYLHLFSTKQPDLNYHCEALVKDMESIMKFYLDKGVYGFRCDVLHAFWKTTLEDGKFHFSNIGREHYEDQPGAHALLQRYRKDVLNNYDCFLVAELASATVEKAKPYMDNKEVEMFFTFEHQNVDKNQVLQISGKKYKPKNLLKVLYRYQNAFKYNCNYLENHDQKRSISRFGSKKYNKESAKALATLLVTLKGTPFIYQGEEIGMSNLTYKVKGNDSKDVVGNNVYNLARKYHLPKGIANKIASSVSRDDERCPMQWNSKVNAGFNNGTKPWTFLNTTYKNGVNVDDETKDENSILNYYKKLIHLRNDIDILQFGEFVELKSNKNIAKYIRNYKNKKILIIINLSSKYIKDIDSYNKKLLLSNYNEKPSEKLPPFYAAIYEIE
ncbi:MAG: alpha-glucosidase [Bacilli bacterium]